MSDETNIFGDDISDDKPCPGREERDDRDERVPEDEADDGPEISDRLHDWLAEPKTKLTLAALACVAVLLGVGALAWQLAGPVSAVVYLTLFLAGLGGIPVFIIMAAPSLPNSLGAPLGRGMWILQQMSFGTGYLVEFEGEYRMCPGEKGGPGESGRVYIDGKWHDVEGTENMTVLGWQPFGTLRHKDDSTMAESRVDQQADDQQATATDGGPGAAEIATMGINSVIARASGGDSTNSRETNTRTQGGYSDVERPTDPDGWVVDLVSWFDSGLRQIGDIETIEKSEEVAMRDEAKESTTAGNGVLIGSIVGLILGAMTGYLVMMA